MPRPGKAQVLVAPPEVLERGLCAAVASAKAADPLALVVVLTPGAATAESVRRILAGGLGVVLNVEVFTYAGFVEMLSSARRGGRPGEVFSAAQERVLARAVTANAKGWFEPLAGMPGFGDAFCGFLAELRGARVSPEALTRAGLPIEIRRKLSSLATSAREFEQRRGDRRTHEDRVEDATVVVERTMGGVPVMLYGVTGRTDADTRLLERLLHATAATAFLPMLRPPAGNSVARAVEVLRRSGAQPVTTPPEPEAAGEPTALTHLQRHIFRVPDQPAPEDASVRLVSADGPAAEAREAARACATWAGEGIAFEEMAVVVPSGSTAYADMAAAALAGSGLPCVVTVPTALRRTPAGRALLDTLEPPGRDPGAGVDLGEDPSWATRVGALKKSIGQDVEGASAVAAALDELLLDGSCDPPRDDEFRAACEVVLSAPGSCAPAARSGVVVMSPDAVGLARFTAVALVGLAEGYLPRAQAGANLLSDAEKVRLNEALAAELPLAERALEREPADFAAVVLAARRALLLVAPRADFDGSASSASPYFRAACIALTGEAVAAADIHSSPRVEHAQPASSTVAQAPGPGAAAWNARRQGDAFTGYEGIVDPAVLGRVDPPLPHRGLSPTRLETYAACPFRFLVENVYAVRRGADERARFGLDARERGSLVHLVLERFLGRIGDDHPAAQHRAAHQELLDTIATEVFAEFEERGITGVPAVWRQTQAAITADLRRWWEVEAGINPPLGADSGDDGWRPRMLEVAFGRAGDGEEDHHPALVFETGVGAVEVAGRIDRVDVSADGSRFRVTDYKTGEKRGAAPPGPPALQLPLYTRAAAALTGLPLDEGVAEYFYVTRKGGYTRSRSDVDSGEDLDGIVERLCAGIAAGDFHPDPSTCRRTGSCQYPEICSRQVSALTRGRSVPPAGTDEDEAGA